MYTKQDDDVNGSALGIRGVVRRGCTPFSALVGYVPQFPSIEACELPAACPARFRQKESKNDGTPQSGHGSGGGEG